MDGVKARGEVFHCNVCGNVVVVASSGGGVLVCCDQPMIHEIEKTTDSGADKHLPVVVLKNEKTEIDIGESPHPMEVGHYIEWVEIWTNRQIIRHYFSPTDEPKTTFCLNDEKMILVRAYCNIHGLWCKNLENQV